MLMQLIIRHITIIEHLDLEFYPGFTCITGETGAGKSISLEALRLCLGERAHTDIIHPKHQQGEISAHFDVTHLLGARHWLQQQELLCGLDCIVRRTFQQGGRSRSYINGTPVPTHIVRQLSEHLIHIHSQHNQHQLLKPDIQRQQLDLFIGHSQLLTEVASAFDEYQRLLHAQNQALAKEREQHAQKELLNYQINELLALALQDNEYKELEQQHRLQAHTTELMQRYTQILHIFDHGEHNGIMSELNQVQQHVQHIQRYDPQAENIDELVKVALIHLQEVYETVHRNTTCLDCDPREFAQTEQRLSEILALSKKHCVAPEQLDQYIQQKQQALDSLEKHTAHIDTLQNNLQIAQQHYLKQAQRLTQSRIKGAKKLAKILREQLKNLDMHDINVQIMCESTTSQMHRSGIDRIEWRMSTNKGHEPQALNKVASGGELSRIALVSQLCIARQHVVPTLIFDEIDVGVSGHAANRVGQMLRDVADTRQIVAITHLPQVAARGHHHWFAHKKKHAQQVTTGFAHLQTSERLHELARLISGSQITPNTLASAKELLQDSTE